MTRLMSDYAPVLCFTDIFTPYDHTYLGLCQDVRLYARNYLSFPLILLYIVSNLGLQREYVML